MYEDPNYDNHENAWLPFNKNLASLSAQNKMKNGNYFQMEKSSFRMVQDFSSHHCNIWNYTQSANGTSDPAPNIFQRLSSKIKLSFATLF